MSPEEIKDLRKQLKLSARELASAIKAETEDVWAWESGDRFPTKRFVNRMGLLKKKGPPKPNAASVPADKSVVPTSAPVNAPPMVKLGDPEFWALVRKLLAHPALYARASELAKTYADPAPGAGKGSESA